MTSEEKYLEIGLSIPDSEKSQMFGKPCFKIKGKAFMSLFQNCIVFKLTGEIHTEALSLDGSELFDPLGNGRPMKEWVQVPFDYEDKWENFAVEANEYVLSQIK
jgi:hypothetical protein